MQFKNGNLKVNYLALSNFVCKNIFASLHNACLIICILALGRKYEMSEKSCILTSIRNALACIYRCPNLQRAIKCLSEISGAVSRHTVQAFRKFLKILEILVSEIFNSIFNQNYKISLKMEILAHNITI